MSTKADKRQARKQAKTAADSERRAPITARNPTQKLYLQSLRQNAMTIAFGPAGTGKTYLPSCYYADLLSHGEINRLILTRPAVGAGGERLGFLPGTAEEKMAPWTRPLVDAIKSRMGGAKTDLAIKNKQIEFVPFEHMRGLTFSDCAVILDEAQNTTHDQMKLWTSRIGENCRAAICGDTTQSDLSRTTNGLMAAVSIVKARGSAMGVGLVEFQNEDIVRSALCREWVIGWSDFEEAAQEKLQRVAK